LKVIERYGNTTPEGGKPAALTIDLVSIGVGLDRAPPSACCCVGSSPWVPHQQHPIVALMIRSETTASGRSRPRKGAIDIGSELIGLFVDRFRSMHSPEIRSTDPLSIVANWT